MKTVESALQKVGIQRTIIHFNTAVVDFIDSLYDDDDCEDAADASAIPDEMIFKNPYTEAQIRSALQKICTFYLTKNVIEDFQLSKVVSTPDLLYLELIIKIEGHEFDNKICHKF